jgi:hypothetical protein
MTRLELWPAAVCRVPEPVVAVRANHRVDGERAASADVYKSLEHRQSGRRPRTHAAPSSPSQRELGSWVKVSWPGAEECGLRAQTAWDRLDVDCQWSRPSRRD